MTTLNPLAVTAEALLRALKATPDAKPAALAEASGRKPNNISRDLKALEEAGLLQQFADGTRDLTEAAHDQLAALDRAAGTAEAPAGYLQLRHDQLRPDPQNARKSFDPDSLAALADNIYEKGILQAPAAHAVPDANGVRQLTMGERRWRAWGLLIKDGRWPADHVESIKLSAGDELSRVEAGLIENLQRDDLNHMERGEGFELLAAKYGRTNAEIAKAVGYSPEYVQQHRRLVGLDESSKEALRTEDLKFHDALKILAAPKPDPLSPQEMLVLGEFLHRSMTHPRKGAYSSGCEVSYRAGADPILSKLRKRNAVSFTEEHWSDHKAYVEPSWSGRDLLHQMEQRLKKAPEATLDELREAASVSFAERVVARPNREPEPYVTKWLNPDGHKGAFYLSPKAKAAIEEDKAKKQREKDKVAAEKLAREKRLATLRALDTDLRQTQAEPVDPRLPTFVAAADIALPVQLKNGRIVDAKGNAVADCNWRFGDRGEAVNLLLATLINAATGYGAAPADDRAAEEIAEVSRKAKDRPEFVDWIADRLSEKFPAWKSERCRSQAGHALDSYSKRTLREFGQQPWAWNQQHAANLADDFAADLAEAAQAGDRLVEA